MNKGALIAGIVIYIVSIILGFLGNVALFFPPLRLVTMIGTPVTKYLGMFLIVYGAWVAFKTRNEFTNIEEEKIT